MGRECVGWNSEVRVGGGGEGLIPDYAQGEEWGNEGWEGGGGVVHFDALFSHIVGGINRHLFVPKACGEVEMMP